MYTIIFLDNGNKMFKCNSKTLKELVAQMYKFLSAKYLQRGK